MAVHDGHVMDRPSPVGRHILSSTRSIPTFVAALFAALAFVGITVAGDERARGQHSLLAQPATGDVLHATLDHPARAPAHIAAMAALAQAEASVSAQADLPFLDAASYAAVDPRVSHAEAPDRLFPAAEVSPRRAQARDPPHTI